MRAFTRRLPRSSLRLGQVEQRPGEAAALVFRQQGGQVLAQRQVLPEIGPEHLAEIQHFDREGAVVALFQPVAHTRQAGVEIGHALQQLRPSR